MTDQHEPQRRTPEASAGGVPSAGGSPAPDTAADEPTRPLTVPDTAADEPTRPLTVPDIAPRDEPTVAAPPAGAAPPVADAPPPADAPAPVAELESDAAGTAVEAPPADRDAPRSEPEPATEPEPDEPAETEHADAPASDASPDPVIPPTAEPASGARARLTSAGALIWVLLALFGFTLVVQLRSNSADEGLSAARQEDLVRILSDLESRDDRLRAEIATLEQSQRQLSSGVAGRQAAQAEAAKRADELGLLAGTEPGRGPGLVVRIDPRGRVKASAVLNAVQELRGAGGEVMQISGSDGTAVRIVASTYFIDGDAGTIGVDGARLIGPYTLLVIGPAQTMQTALQIPGGVVASVETAGGSVTMQARNTVEVTALRRPVSLRYARPVS
jgi:uncharacterized protein YlxW (UPF0749 family)